MENDSILTWDALNNRLPSLLKKGQGSGSSGTCQTVSYFILIYVWTQYYLIYLGMVSRDNLDDDHYFS